MTVEDDILKTLQKIERVLVNQSSAGRQSGAAAGTGNQGQNANNANNAIKVSIKSLNLFTTATLGATNALGGFKQKVQSTTSLVHNLNRTLRRYNNNLNQNRNNGQGSPNGNGIQAFDEAVNKVTNRLTSPTGLFKQLTTLTAHVRLINRNLGGRPPGPGPGSGPGPGPDPAPSPGNRAGLGDLLKMSAITSAVLASLNGIKNIAGTIVLEDMFQRLAARGYGTTEALGTLYSSAIQAGMSLAEYNKMMDENMVSVSRFSSFEAFNSELEKSRDVLAKYGIFGIEAAEMSASMISNASALGIKTGDVNSVVDAQIKMFTKLRESTNITAEEFRDLAKRMQDDDDVQRELIGLSYSQKASRIVELQQVSTLGRAMNLTAAGSEKLRTALEQQRKSTLKDRFQQAGIIRQTAALTGMGGAEGEELAKLSLKKRKTPEENKRFLELNAKQLAVIEAMQNSGDKTQEFLADQITARREAAGLGTIDTASVAAANATAAGPIINENFNKTLSELSQRFGKAVAIFEGLAKNPVGTAVGNLISTAFSALLSGGIFALLVGGRISAAVSAALAPVVAAALAALARARGLPPPGPNPPPGPQPRGRGRFGRMLGGGLGLLTLGVTAASSISDYNGAESIAAQRTGDEKDDADRVKGEAIGDVAGTVIGTAIGGALSLFTGGLAAAILVPFGGIVGGWLGKMAGGWLGATTATEKNTAEIKKNTEVLRAQAPTNEISNDNLGSLGANVMASGKAFYGGNQNSISAAEKIVEKQTIKEVIATPVNNSQKTIMAAETKKAPENSINNSTEKTIREKIDFASTTPDQTTTLSQILSVLQEALSFAKSQAEQKNTILRSLSSNKLSDNSQAIKNALLF